MKPKYQQIGLSALALAVASTLGACAGDDTPDFVTDFRGRI